MAMRYRIQDGPAYPWGRVVSLDSMGHRREGQWQPAQEAEKALNDARRTDPREAHWVEHR